MLTTLQNEHFTHLYSKTGLREARKNGLCILSPFFHLPHAPYFLKVSV